MARAKLIKHTEWHYTGNHPNGQNTIYEDGETELMQLLGLRNDGDNKYIVAGEISDRGEYTHNGLRVTAKWGRQERDNFGYKQTVTYRVEAVNA